MHTGLKVGIFATALAATFGSAYGSGKAVGPVAPDAPAARHADHAAHGGRAPAVAPSPSASPAPNPGPRTPAAGAASTRGRRVATGADGPRPSVGRAPARCRRGRPG